jgi:flavin reductase (DIM6/NTAB) family NADH-FMN oxidoreductase RutF
MKEVDIEEALKFRHPEIVVNVVTKSAKGKIDVTPIGWAMLGSSKPKTWAIGVGKDHFSHKAILESKEFTVCLPSFSQKEETLFCGTHTGWKTDKLAEAGLKISPAIKVSTPLLDGSLACYECKLVDQMETSDSTIFLGEILAAHTSGQNAGLINLGHSNLVLIERGTKKDN